MVGDRYTVMMAPYGGRLFSQNFDTKPYKAMKLLAGLLVSDFRWGHHIHRTGYGVYPVRVVSPCLRCQVDLL